MLWDYRWLWLSFVEVWDGFSGSRHGRLCANRSLMQHTFGIGTCLGANACSGLTLPKMGDVRLIRMCKCSELFCKVQFVLCFNPNRSLCRLSIILGCFHCFLLGFRLLVEHLVCLILSTWPAMPSRIKQLRCSTSKQNQSGSDGRLGGNFWLSKSTRFLF